MGNKMIKYAVNLIKNTFHPLQIAESAHVEHGQLVLVRTEKGEEVAKVFVVNPLIAKAWESKMPYFSFPLEAAPARFSGWPQLDNAVNKAWPPPGWNHLP